MRPTADGVVLAVHVQPRASHTECAGLHGTALKIRVAAPPTEGAANDELCRFLARLFHVPIGAVQVMSVANSRQKRLLVKGRSADEVRVRLKLD